MPQTQPTTSGGPQEAQDPRIKALATGLELARNAVGAKNLEELQFILVNDTRALITFDRAMLIVHFDGKSSLSATNNQPKLESKSAFVRTVNKLSGELKKVERGLVLFSADLKTEGLPPETAGAIKEFIEYSKCACCIIIPFSVHDTVVAHMVLEFFEGPAPSEVEILTFMNLVPFFSFALAEKWLLATDPRANKAYVRSVFSEVGDRSRRLWTRILLAGLVLGAVIALCLPVTLQVGGKAEAAPDYEYAAYAQMDGIVDKVLVKEGEFVKKDQVLAVLEAREIDYKIREAQRLLESYRAEMEILRNLAAENPQKLAESQLVAIKSLRAKLDLEFLGWQRQFLEIRSPVDGTVLTKKLETLIGKKFKAGEPLCKIATHNLLVTEVFVRESDASFVSPGQTGEVFFNYRPNHGYRVVVKTVAPKGESLERTGSVFRVKTEFLAQPDDIKPGMQGIAHIDTKEASLWYVMTRRIKAKINEFFLFL